MTKNEHKNLEIALLLCLPDSFEKAGLDPKSRKGRLVHELADALNEHMRNTPKVRFSRIEYLTQIILDFADDLRWNRNKKHAHTVLAFSLEIMERSQFKYPKKVWDATTALVEHIENKTPAYPACCAAGILAADKWEKLIKKEQNVPEKTDRRGHSGFKFCGDRGSEVLHGAQVLRPRPGNGLGQKTLGELFPGIEGHHPAGCAGRTGSLGPVAGVGARG